jgi:hypothetical protein
MAELTMNIKLPPRMADQVQQLVKDGWVSDFNSLVIEALRRYIETHQGELSERFIMDDVEWGLKGDE